MVAALRVSQMQRTAPAVAARKPTARVASACALPVRKASNLSFAAATSASSHRAALAPLVGASVGPATAASRLQVCRAGPAGWNFDKHDRSLIGKVGFVTAAGIL